MLQNHHRDNSLQNNNVITQRYVRFVQIDSSQRNIQPINNYSESVKLPPYSIRFKNESSIVTVDFPNHTFKVDDKIILNNVTSKMLMLNNVLTVKKNSNFFRILHKNHGLSLYGLYDPTNDNDFMKIDYVDILPSTYTENDDIPDINFQYYILKKNVNIDLMIQLSNIKGSNMTRTLIGNIPTNYLNKKHRIYLIFVKSEQTYYHDHNSYVIFLEKKSSTNYMDGFNFIKDKNGNLTKTIFTNNTYIKFHNLYGIPLNYLNSGTPINENTKFPYMTILSTTQNTFSVNTNYPAIVDPNISFYSYDDLSDYVSDYDFDNKTLINSNRGGGPQVYVRKIFKIIPGYPNPNSYVCRLDKVYRNIVQIRLINSIFPKSQRTINDNLNDIFNNKLYWRNLDDGDYIYQLSLTPGNYSPFQLKEAIEKKFLETIRYKYTTEYKNGIEQPIIKKTTPSDDLIYDENGYNKYHIVNVDISSITDRVSLTSYKEILQTDKSNGKRIISIPNTFIKFTMANDIRKNFGIDVINPSKLTIVPQIINPFNPLTDTLFIYFTSNSHMRIGMDFPHAYGNLYKYDNHITDTIDGYNTFLAKHDSQTAILINFHRTKKIYPIEESINELNSINTSTKLTNFNYNYLTKEIQKLNHSLKIGDLIITDQFIDPNTSGQIFVYEIDNIKDREYFTVKKYNHGEKYKFIYDSIIINFNSAQNKDSQYWLDQVTTEQPITSLQNSEQITQVTSFNNTLSFTMIMPLSENNNFMIIYHPNHQLREGDNIIISNSTSVNHVPETVINGEHTIKKIIDENHYQILLNVYASVPNINNDLNVVLLKYPDIFQLFFNFEDTLGNSLNFYKIGEKIAITPYKHTIFNTDPYENDYNYDSLGTEYEQKLKKIDNLRYNYFYICCPELGSIDNTNPVNDVFAIIKWYDNSGSIVIDSFVSTVNYYHVPIPSISELHFTMKQPNGLLVDFNGMDHSFTLEIIELYNQSVGTEINARMI